MLYSFKPTDEEYFSILLLFGLSFSTPWGWTLFSTSSYVVKNYADNWLTVRVDLGASSRADSRRESSIEGLNRQSV